MTRLLRRLRHSSARRLTLIAMALGMCSLANGNKETRPQKPPYDVGYIAEPRLFAEGLVSTEDDESGGTFSPDGTEFYFVKIAPYTYFPRFGLICVTRFRHGQWMPPEALPFSGKYLDFPPQLSPDGKTMYFSSTRPAPGTTARTLRIWAVDRTADGWGEPRVLPVPVNADDSWNWGPSVTGDGVLYFASNRDGRASHIYRSRPFGGSYTPPEKLGPEINSDFNEADPYISPDETLLIFSSSATDLGGESDRPETMKGGGVLYARADLYISIRRNGNWSPARHIGHNVNSVADEGSPSLTPDGKYLFFSSERSPFTVPTAHRLNYVEIEAMLHSTLNGHGNIFFVSRAALEVDDSQERP